MVNIFGPIPTALAQEFKLPVVGVMVHLSAPLDPPILKGIKVHPDNIFRFEFILDKGDGELSSSQLKEESSKLIKYFLASLTIPEKDLWVNLSPYEKDRIIPQSFGLTEMGRDLLAEDYMLKQITASLIYPEDNIGKKFWKRIYEEASKHYGTTNIPVNTFNKVWIIPEKAVVFENAKAGTAYVVESKLIVMLEQDYLSLDKHEGIQSITKNTNQLGNRIVHEIVLPELTKEVNEDKNFAMLRQVYNSLILATWYKNKIKNSILNEVFAGKNKTAGVEYTSSLIPAKYGDKVNNDIEAIYQRYLRAFKKGVYNYIKVDVDPFTQESIPRKYFSGGMDLRLLPSDSAMTSLSAKKVFTVIRDKALINASFYNFRRRLFNVAISISMATAVLLTPFSAQSAKNKHPTSTQKHTAKQPVKNKSVAVPKRQVVTQSIINKPIAAYVAKNQPVAVPQKQIATPAAKNQPTAVAQKQIAAPAAKNQPAAVAQKQIAAPATKNQPAAVPQKQIATQPAKIQPTAVAQKQIATPVAKNQPTAVPQKQITAQAPNNQPPTVSQNQKGIKSVKTALSPDAVKLLNLLNQLNPQQIKEITRSVLQSVADNTKSSGHGAISLKTMMQRLQIPGKDLDAQLMAYSLTIFDALKNSPNLLEHLKNSSDPLGSVNKEIAALIQIESSWFLTVTSLRPDAGYDQGAMQTHGFKHPFSYYKDKPLEYIYETVTEHWNVTMGIALKRAEEVINIYGPSYMGYFGIDKQTLQFFLARALWNGGNDLKLKVLSRIPLLVYVPEGRLTFMSTKVALAAAISGIQSLNTDTPNLKGSGWGNLNERAAFDDDILNLIKKLNDIDRSSMPMEQRVQLYNAQKVEIANKISNFQLKYSLIGVVAPNKFGNNSTLNLKLSSINEGGNASMQSNVAAMVTPINGGIDLNPANLNLQTQNSGSEIKFNMDPAILEQLKNAPGFVPVIISIEPMISLNQFLGLNDQDLSPENLV